MDTQGTSAEAIHHQAEGLSELEIRILDFERQWWRFAGAKDFFSKVA